MLAEENYSKSYTLCHRAIFLLFIIRTVIIYSLFMIALCLLHRMKLDIVLALWL